jgi:hypothetical protein
MLDENVKRLMELYLRDLQDLDKLLNIMENFGRLLETNSSQKEEERPIANLTFDQDDRFEQSVIQFASDREQIVLPLLERVKTLNLLEREVVSETGKTAFQPELQGLLQERQERLRRIREKDQEILSRLGMELESIKLELSRIQDARKKKSAYEQRQTEARFIDKIK